MFGFLYAHKKRSQAKVCESFFRKAKSSPTTTKLLAQSQKKLFFWYKFF